MLLSAAEHLPEQIETPPLLIRVAKPGDGAVFNQAILGSLPQLSPWLGWVTPAPTLEASEHSCRKAYARFLMNEDLMVFFFLKKTPGRPKFSDSPLGGGTDMARTLGAFKTIAAPWWAAVACTTPTGSAAASRWAIGAAAAGAGKA